MVGYGKSLGDYIRTQDAQHMYGLNICVPHYTYVEALIPSVMVFGGGTFGR